MQHNLFRGEQNEKLKIAVIFSMADLEDSIKVLEEGFTKLVVDLVGVDPEDAFSVIPYIKGNAVNMFYIFV